jgi:type III secretory pathway component EscS
VELLIEHLGHGLMLALILSLPAVLVAASIGLIVGILQAVTQVQEQTIAAAPKILGVFAILLMGGGLMMTMLENYVRESFQIAFNEIPQDGKFIMPPLSSRGSAQARARAFFDIQSKEGSNSERLKAMAAQWPTPTDAKSAVLPTLKIPAKTGAGNALAIPEKMALDKRH